MSIILKALKSSQAETSASVPLQKGEGFFRGKESFVSKKTSLKLVKSEEISKKQILLSIAILIVFAVGGGSFWKLYKPVDVPQVVIAPKVFQPVPAQTVPKKSIPDFNVNEASARANLAFQQGDLQTSLKIYKEIIAHAPEEAKIYNNFGLLLTESELYTNASTAYQKALEIDPACAACFNNFGYLKTLLGEAVVSEKYLLKSIELDNTYANPYFNLGVLYEKNGDVGKAVKYYQQFLLRNSNKKDELVFKIKRKVKELGG